MGAAATTASAAQAHATAASLRLCKEEVAAGKGARRVEKTLSLDPWPDRLLHALGTRPAPSGRLPTHPEGC